MATFIPGMTDVFPASGPFDLDFNRVERMLKLREGMYQQGAKKVKSLYDSIFSSAMLRDDNIEKRDAYLKTITESLNSVSALDFSLPQNQQVATSLFDPITTDKTIVKDIGFTKKYMNELSKAESLRGTKQYWEIGKRALDYKAEEFRNADPTTALTMSAPRYTPNIDITTMAQKMFKESGISVKQDQISGNYIWTKKNGDLVFPIAQSYVNTIFSQDAGIQEMLRTQAYVTRKDFIKQNSQALGGDDKAEIAYLTNTIRKLGADAQKDVTAAEGSLAQLKSKMDSWDKKIRTQGIIPNRDNPEYIQYLEDAENLQRAEQAIQNLKDNVVSLNNVKYDDINDMRAAADGYVTMFNYELLSKTVAKNLAFKNAEITVKADPVGLSVLRAELQLRNQKTMEQIRTTNRKSEIQLRADLGLNEGSGNKKPPTLDQIEKDKLQPTGGDNGRGVWQQADATPTPKVESKSKDENSDEQPSSLND
jgi:hypothetical protein